MSLSAVGWGTRRRQVGKRFEAAAPARTALLDSRRSTGRDSNTPLPPPSNFFLSPPSTSQRRTVARRMGGAKRYSSIAMMGSMGFAKTSTHPTRCEVLVEVFLFFHLSRRERSNCETVRVRGYALSRDLNPSPRRYAPTSPFGRGSQRRRHDNQPEFITLYIAASWRLVAALCAATNAC